MSIHMLETTPMGFVFELSGGCYQSSAPYDIYLNGAFVRHADENVAALFGLEPDTDYDVELRGLDIRFAVRTQPLQWLIDVRKHGALGDGIHDDTAAIAAAIYTAPEGATVRFPRGAYLVSQVLLRSGIDLYLEAGATLRHAPDRAHLALLPGFQWDRDHDRFDVSASWEGNPLPCYMSLIYGKGISDVRIYGEGALDGSGAEGGFWRQPKTRDGNGGYRPRNLSLYDCERVCVMGITSRNSAAWNLHPVRSDALRFLALDIQSDPSSPNTDGLNPESCRDVLICGCRFAVGDDCIAIKSGKPFMARTMHRPSERIEIRNCLMRDGHGAVVIGSEIASGVLDVQIARCRIERTDRGLRIKTRRGRGERSIVDGIEMRDCTLRGVRHCLVVNMFYNCDPDGHSEYVSSKAPRAPGADTPTVRNIAMRGVRADGITGSAAFAYGLPERPVKGVVMEDCAFEFAEDRVAECPAMMDGFEATGPIDFFFEHAEVSGI